jgi:tricorn protease
MTPPQSESTRLKVGVAIDNSESRPRFAKGSKYVRDVSISPSGSRVAVEFRGEIVTVPAEKGEARNLTGTPDTHERSPAWSPDGKTIAYFSDAGGEYQLVLAPQNGKGEAKKIKLAGTGSGFYFDPIWSRDSKKVLFRDVAQTVFYCDVESGKLMKVVEPKHGLSRGLKASSWSPDSKWIAYAVNTPAQISRVYAYSLETGKATPITDGLTEAAEPCFDAGGKYLYFLSSIDTGMSKHGFSQSAADARQPRWSVNLAVLNKDLPSPFLRENDEEKGEPEKPLTKGEKKERDAAFAIDFADIDQRILSFPLPAGNYAGLSAGAAGQLFYLTRAEAEAGGRGGPGGGATLNRYDMERKRAAVVQAGVAGYELTPDGRKLLYSTGGNWFITSAAGGGGAPPTGLLGGAAARPTGAPAAPAAAAGPSGDGKLNFETVEVRVDPRAEWKQIFEEAWRINRDFFYDPNMHGADWPAMKQKYAQFLPHLTSSADLYRVIRWMLSELAVGHSYITSFGERPFERKTVPGGLLGADFELKGDRYAFKKIYGGLNWNAATRSPLTAPGVNVREGEFLLAVNGKELKAPTEIYSLFENTAGKLIELTVGPNADGTKSRTVTVEPIASEANLRNMDWVEGNLRKVEKATGGRVGYVHVRDTAAGGMADFKRYFFPQVDKEGLIIDERFNSGGQIADYYIDILRRPFASYWAPRYGADNRSPSAAIFGPKVMIIDEGAGSGGDMLPYMFRKFGIGPLVGKRTWGGLVGIGGYPVLMDGGTVTAPSFAIWDPEKGFIVENEGVAPDHDVTMLPKDLIAGKDPQLEKAIELALEGLKKSPPKKDARPEYPRRALPPVPAAVVCVGWAPPTTKRRPREEHSSRGRLRCSHWLLVACGGHCPPYKLLPGGALHPHRDRIKAGPGGDEQRLHVLPAEAHVRGPRLRHVDLGHLLAGLVVDGHPLPGQVHVPLLVEGHAVGALFAEQRAVRERAVRGGVVAVGLAGADVGDVQCLPVGRADDSVRLLDLARVRSAQLPVGRQEVNALLVLLGRPALPVRPLVEGVGEERGAVIAHPDVVRAVQELPAVVLYDEGLLLRLHVDLPQLVLLIRARPEGAVLSNASPFDRPDGSMNVVTLPSATDHLRIRSFGWSVK